MSAEPVDQISRRALGNDLPVIHNCQAVAQALGFIHVMRGEQHGAAIALKSANDVPKLAPALGIESRGRLVEKQNLWIANQRRRYGQPLALPARELSHPRVGFLGQLQLLENFFGRARLAVETGEEFNGLAHGKLFRQARLLQRDPQPLAHLALILAPAVPQNRHLPRSRREQAFEDFNGCGLPRPVRPEQAKALAGLDLQVQATHGLDFAIIGLAQVTALNGYGHWVILPDVVFLRRPCRSTTSSNFLTLGGQAGPAYGWPAKLRPSLTRPSLPAKWILLKYRIAGSLSRILFPCASLGAASLDGVPSKTPVCRFQPVLSSRFSFPVEDMKGSAYAAQALCLVVSVSCLCSRLSGPRLTTLQLSLRFYGEKSAGGQESPHLDSRGPVGRLSGSENRFRQGRLAGEENPRIEIWQRNLLCRDQPRASAGTAL